MQTINIHKFSIPEIIFGPDSMRHVSVCARQLGAKKVFLVSDKGLEKVGWVGRLMDILKDADIQWAYYSDVTSNPRDYEVHRGAKIYLSEKCDVVVALGGGSPMDAAKGIATIAMNGGLIKDYEGANRIQKPLPPMVFIPTTAGSGADISQFAIITDVEKKTKMSIISRTLVPNVSIIDPMILTTKPNDLIIHTALDALCHAIESYVSKIASPFTEPQSLLAIRLIFEHLIPAIETHSIEHLCQLSIACSSAAMAFSNASLGAVHALAHSLGGILDIFHGMSHPILLPHVMRFNLPVCADKLANIGEIIIGKRLKSNYDTALAGIEEFEKFCSNLNIPLKLREIADEHLDMKKLCKMALRDVCLLTNPRKVLLEDLIMIYEQAW